MGKEDKAKKEKLSGFEGFDEITKNIIPGSDNESGEDFLDDIYKQNGEDDEEEIDETNEEVDEEDEPLKDDKSKKSQKTKEDEEDEPAEDDEEGDNKQTTDDIDETEFVEPFVDLFAEELGWEIDEDKKPKNIGELVEFMSSIVESNSKPKYSSDVSAKFDKFVADGGDPKEFFNKYYGGFDISKLSLKNEEHQKQILRELYRRRGFNDAKIEKNIQRIEDHDELEEEAKDAYSELESMDSESKESILREQEENKKKVLKERIDFVDAVEDHVTNIDNVYGIKINKKEKEDLMSHIFAVGKDGKTQQQRDYAENPIEYLIITSYAYKNKDKIKSLLQGKSETNAVQKFKEKQKQLSAKSRNKNDGGEDFGETGNDWLDAFKLK